MTGNRCVLCGSTRATDSGASFHRFPADKTARARWIANLQLGADAVKLWGAVCVKTIFLRKPPLFVPRFSFVATILFSRRRFPFRGDDSLFAATILFSRRRLSFRGDDSLFAATIVFSWRRFSFRGDDSLFVATNRYGVPFVSKRLFSVNPRIPRCDMFFQATNRKRGDE